MSELEHHTFAATAVQRPWDARLARRLVAPLIDTWVSPNHLTSVRLVVGLAAAAAFVPGTYLWSIAATLMLGLSNFLDHTDGELARLSGKTSRFGHLYDLASDALITVLLFIAIGAGMAAHSGLVFEIPPTVIGAIAGSAVALIFYLRMRIEDLAGKKATRQGSFGGFETEDVLYLMPLAALFNGLPTILIAASICAPLYAVWAAIEYRRVLREPQQLTPPPTSGVVQ